MSRGSSTRRTDCPTANFSTVTGLLMACGVYAKRGPGLNRGAGGPAPRRASELLEAHVFQRCRPGIRVDQHQGRLLHSRADAARPDVFVDGGDAHALVHEALDLVEHGLPLLP